MRLENGGKETIMKRYISVDSGKFGTKIAEYMHEEDAIRKFSIRTKVSQGYMEDDAIEKNTVVVEIDGQIYKVGNGARGDGASLDTDKNDKIHYISTLTALATVASANEIDEFYVAIGLPAKDWALPPKREEYKKAMLPEGDISITIRPNSKVEPVKKTFRIVERYAYPESIGALFMDGVIEDVVSNPNIPTGVIDVGNLNANITFWQGTELIYDKSSTHELGGAILIQELAQELSSNIDYCDEIVAANLLKADPSERHLPYGLGLSDEEVEESKRIVDQVLRGHADKLRRACKARNWSLKATRIVAIGGTSEDIENYLIETFGNVTVLPESNYCNALGYLRLMCSKIADIGKLIELTDKKKMNAASLTEDKNIENISEKAS